MTLFKTHKHLALGLIAFTICLYALAARDGHNWKGDFSQYVMHAQNLIAGKPYTDIQVLSIDGVAHKGTPPGYPLVIAPLLALFGLNFIALKVQMAVIFGLGLLIYWHHIKPDLPWKWALGALSFLAFSPWILKFSTNLLTDIPYLTSSLLVVFLAHRFFQSPPNFNAALYLILSLFLNCSFRSVGIVLIGVLFIYALLLRRSHLIPTIGIVAVTYIAVGMLYRLFKAGGGYATQFSLDPMVIATAVWNNLIGLERTLTLILALFPSRNEDSLMYILINKPILLAYLSLAGMGWYRSYKKRGLYVQDIYVPLCLIPLLIYPYPMRPRYLLPILPFTHFYMVIGLRGIFAGIMTHFPKYLPKLLRRYRAFMPTLIWLPLFLAYWGHYTLRPTTVEANIFLDPDVQGLFEEVKQQKQDITHVLFWRPRILHLMTGVPSAGVYNINQHPWSPKEVARISKLGVSHLILDPHNPKLAEFAKQNESLFKSIYKNQTFHLLRIERNHPIADRSAH